MTKELSTQVSFSKDEIATIKNTVAVGATDNELKLFLHQCKRTQLDPFSRQIYFLKMGGKASIQSSIDGFRLIAERSGKYAGQTTPLLMDKEGNWHEVWMVAGYPVAAKVGVLRSDFKEPLYAIAKWSSYAPTYNGKLGTMWAKMPEVMLAKVAEALALRKAFPNDLSGIYAAEEMAQADNKVPEVVPTVGGGEKTTEIAESKGIEQENHTDTPVIDVGVEDELANAPLCPGCGQIIGEDEQKYSKRMYGVEGCRDCQKNMKKK